jgi:hypothetical protein
MANPKVGTNKITPVIIKLILVLIVIALGVLGWREYNQDKTTDQDGLVGSYWIVTDYDGVYRGNTGAAAGLTNIVITISKGVATGTATFIGSASNYDLNIPVTFQGAITHETGLEVAISGIGYATNASADPFSLGGQGTGQASSNTINFNYMFVVAGQTFNSNVILSK